MMRSALLLVVALLSGDRLAAQEVVEARGITSSIKLEKIVYSHIEELNGKYKMQATEATFAPGAHLGVHHHVGPGVRYVLSGELTFTEGGKVTIYHAGDYFFETGNIAHTADNKTDLPLRILFVELLSTRLDRPESYSTQAIRSRERPEARANVALDPPAVIQKLTNRVRSWQPRNFAIVFTSSA